MEVAPPPTRPELPEGVDRRPRWPAWYAGVGFMVALIGTLIAVVILAAAFGINPEDDESAAFTTVATLAQNVVFIGTAVLFASMTMRPRAWHFGLNRTAFWPAVGWAALGIFSFYFFAGIYSLLLQPDAEQGVTEALGADESTFGLISAGFMVVVVAPVAEEVFFRGFFYGALRSRFTVPAAALIGGGLFGVIHWDFTGEGLEILPPLTVLGVIFCLVYERTGSLFPVIGLHALNNAVAYGAQTDGSGTWVSVGFGVAALVGCAVAPRLMRPAPVVS
jgi:membrane protease YdiL (CAAX protease family)